MKQFLKKHKKGVIITVALTLVLVITCGGLIEFYQLNQLQKAVTVYSTLYNDVAEETPEPTHVAYTDICPCNCVYLGEGTGTTPTNSTAGTNNNNSTNTKAGQWEGSSAEEKIWNLLVGKYDEITAAAILGNLCVEDGTFEPSESNGTHIGLAQWDNVDRYPRMLDWCKNNGYDGTTLEGQARYVVHEFYGSGDGYGNVLKYIKAEIKSAEGGKKTYEQVLSNCTYLVARYYEGCPTSDGNKCSHSMDDAHPRDREMQGESERIKHAIRVYLKYNTAGITKKGAKYASITDTNDNVAYAAKKKKNTSKSTTGSTTSTFKVPSLNKIANSYRCLIKKMLPGAVAVSEYYGMSIIGTLGHEPWEGGWNKVTGNTTTYVMYGVTGKNKITGKFVQGTSHKFRVYRDYSESIVDWARNFYETGATYKPYRQQIGNGWRAEVKALAKTGYLGDGGDRDEYVENISGTCEEIEDIGDFENVAFSKACLEKWGLMDEYQNALDWIATYDKKCGKISKPKACKYLNGAVAGTGNAKADSNDGGSTGVDISNVKTAMSLLNFKKENMDKKDITNFTFEYNITKCNKVSASNVMSGTPALDLWKSARSWSAKAISSICVHYTLGGADAMNTTPRLFFNSWNSKGGLGSHFGISGNGTIYQYSTIGKRCAAQNDANSYAIGIEVGAGDPNSASGFHGYSKKAYESTVHLVAYLCYELNIGIECQFIDNSKKNPYWEPYSGLMRHYDAKKDNAFRGKTCPAYYTPNDGSSESPSYASAGGQNRWLAFKAEVYRYIANYKDDPNFKIKNIVGLDDAKVYAAGNKNEFDWSKVDSLNGSTGSVGNVGALWFCDCEIPCSKCHCHDNETGRVTSSDIKSNSSSNNNSGSSSDDDNTVSDSENPSEVAGAVAKAYCNYITKHNIKRDKSVPPDEDIYNGWYSQSEKDFMSIKLPVLNKKKTCRRDCSGFITSVLWALGDYDGGMLRSVSFASKMPIKNWTCKSVDSSYIPKIGDIVAYSGHVEMIAGMSGGKLKVWNWGSEDNYKSYKNNGYKPLGTNHAITSYTVYYRRNTMK